MHLKAAFLHFFIFKQNWNIALASPTTVNSRQHALEHGPSYLNIALMVLGLSLVLLFIAKCVYQTLRYRQSRSRQLVSEDNWSEPLVDVGIFATPPLANGKSGLLVGLFGSPSWETKQSNIFRAASEQIPSSHTQLIATPCRLSISSRNKYVDKTSVDRSHSYDDLGMRRTSEQLGCEPLAELVPAVRSSTYSFWSPQNGKESCCVRTYHNAPASPIMARNLSSSATEDLCESSGPELSWNAIICTIAGRNARHTVTYPKLSHSKTPSGNGHRFSLPYAHSWNRTMARRSRTVSETADNSNSNRSSHPNFLRTVLRDEEERPTEQPGKIRVVLPRNEMTSSLQSTNPSVIQNYNEQLSSTHRTNSRGISVSLTSGQPPCMTDTIANSNPSGSKLYPVPVTTQTQRRSPKVGPSPLRTMFLPEGGSGNKTRRSRGQSYDNAREIPDCVEEIPPILDPRIVGECDTKFSGAQPKKLYRYPAKNPSSKIAKERSKAQDSESLLDLIQDLVQETSAWDDSLFVDQKFKAMINDSKRILTVSLSQQRKGNRTASGRRMQRSWIRALEGIPELEGMSFIYTPESRAAVTVIGFFASPAEIPLEIREDEVVERKRLSLPGRLLDEYDSTK